MDCTYVLIARICGILRPTTYRRSSRLPLVDSAELAGVFGEPHATVHRTLASLLTGGIAGRASHGTAHLPSSRRYYLTAKGIGEAAGILGFTTPSDFVRVYPAAQEWLTLLIRRMDEMAAVYRLAASMSPGIDGLRPHVEHHRRGRFDATITLHDGSVQCGNTWKVMASTVGAVSPRLPLSTLRTYRSDSLYLQMRPVL